MNFWLLLSFFLAIVWSRHLQGLNGPITCIAKNCASEFGDCVKDKKCRSAMLCNMKCEFERDVDGCNLICELTYGYNNTRYTEALGCATKNGCIPHAADDGKCLATDSQTIRNLTSMEQMEGKWWILKGLNCGQPDWPGGFDYFPCQRDEFVPNRTGIEDSWLDYIAYCGGKNNSCTTPMVHTVATANMSLPGVMRHDYLDAPLLPQLEFWRVLSWPHPEWMLYIYCGTTPINTYAGGSVVSNSSRTIDEIPPWVEKIFVETAQKYGFDYYGMCISDVSDCSD